MVSPLKKVSSTTLKRAMTNKGTSKTSIIKRMGTKKKVHIYQRKDGAIKIKGERYALYSRSLDRKRHGKAFSKKHPIGSGRYKHTRDGVRKTGKEDTITTLVKPIGSVTREVMRQTRRRK